MGLASSRDKRDKLRLFYARTAAGGSNTEATLRELLMEALAAADESLSSGLAVTSTSAAGRSVGFSVVEGMPPLMAKRLVGELLDLLDKLEGDSDAETYADMMTELNARKRYIGARFSYLRMGPAAQT